MNFVKHCSQVSFTANQLINDDNNALLFKKLCLLLKAETPARVKGVSKSANVTRDSSAHVCSKANLPRKMVISYQNYLSEDNLLKLAIIHKWRSEGIMRCLIV
jgi:hypothetical protein